MLPDSRLQTNAISGKERRVGAFRELFPRHDNAKAADLKVGATKAREIA
jgi:hypothetical protein